jgi:hypothetical protein
LHPSQNPFDEFPDVFPETKNIELPPLRPGLDHRIHIIDPKLVVRPRPIKPKEKFMSQLLEKLRAEEAAGRIYKSTDTSACAMFMIPKHDKPDEARFLHDLVARNANTHKIPCLIPDQNLIRNTLARSRFCSKIDISDGYNGLRVAPEDEKYTAFLTPYGTFRTKVLQQGDCNAPASFQNAMNNIFKDELGVFVFVYIDDIFIFSNSYKEHLQHVRTVLK